MARVLSLLLCLSLLSCDDDEEKNGAYSAQIGAFMCGKTPSEMTWLSDLVHEASTDPTLNGDIYAGQVDGQTIFIHQPLIMSCLACIIYDCDGKRLDASTLDHEQILTITTPVHKIYAAYR